jgi:hypothetical protein
VIERIERQSMTVTVYDDHHAKGTTGVHRFITGSLTYASGDMKEIKTACLL